MRTPEQKARHAERERAKRAAMTPEERAAYNERARTRWAAMSPEQRSKEAERGRSRWLTMPADKKAARRVTGREFMRRKRAAMSPEERAAFSGAMKQERARKRAERPPKVSGPKRKPLRERFEAKVRVDPSGCRLWAGVTNGRYGVISRGGHQGPRVYAHRAAYELSIGPIPPGMCVCHRCDVPLCVNPEHLFLGTHQDNSQDCVRKGRHGGGMPAGEGSPNAKLTEEQVKYARASVWTGRHTQAQLARFFGVTEQAISEIVARKTWRHV